MLPMRWLEGTARARLTEPSCGRKVNMLAGLEAAAGLGKGSEPLSQICPTLYPGANSPYVRRAVGADVAVPGALQSRSA